MAMTGYPDMSYIIPDLKLIGAPYVISNYDHLKAVLKGPYGQKMDAKFLEKGIRVADVWYEGARHTTANKPIQSISDLKGLKMRTPNVPFLIEYARAVGATPAPVAFAEVYLALTSGQEEIGFGQALPERSAEPVVVASAAVVAGERPRIAVAADEELAHQGRLAALRKKAGRALWDELASA